MNDRTEALSIKNVDAEAVRSLRAEVLRPGLPYEASFYPGDNVPGSAHFGIYDGDTLIGCASVFLEDHPDLPETPHWRLRGMAVEEQHRKKGLGSRLLNSCKQYAKSQGSSLLWCYARTRAIPFYLGQGFTVVGEGFDIDGIGEHFLSQCRLDD